MENKIKHKIIFIFFKKKKLRTRLRVAFNLILRSVVYEDEIIVNVPNPKINADFDTSLHIIKSTAELEI